MPTIGPYGGGLPKQGPAGPIGPTGPTGPTGPQGPPGTSSEISYTESAAGVNITGTTEATANVCVTAPIYAANGTTIILVEFYSPYIQPMTAGDLRIGLYDNGVSLGEAGIYSNPNASQILRTASWIARRLTPAAGNHTYSIRAFGSISGGVVNAGPGGAGLGSYMPMFIRISKVA